MGGGVALVAECPPTNNVKGVGAGDFVAGSIGAFHLRRHPPSALRALLWGGRWVGVAVWLGLLEGLSREI